MSSPTSSTSASSRIDPMVWRVAVVVLIAPIMTQVDSTVVNVALSTIGQSLHASIASAQWIISGYLLAMALMLPLNGWLVDRVGAKRIYLACFTAFTLASLLCGAARTMDELICARIAQGLAGGVLTPMTQMMIARVAGKNMARAMGYVAVPILIAPVVGPVLAGAILAHATWPWLFYLNLPLGVLGVILAFRLLPRDTLAEHKRPFDFPGFMLISPGFVGLIYGLQNASLALGKWSLLAGALLLAGFFLHSVRRGSASLIDVRIFRDRIFSIAAATQFSANAIMFGRQLLIPLYLIMGCALSTAQAGWLISAIGVGMMCSFPLVGFLTDRYGCRAASAGGACLALLSMLPFLRMIEHQFSILWAAISLFAAGAGQGTINIPSITAAYSSIPKDRMPVANTALNIAQRLGGPIATTLLAVVMSLSMHASANAEPRRFLAVFIALTGFHLLTLGAASFLPLRIHRAAES
jgi:EmrB/QacA subfamily drug resistance transporter